MPSEDRPAIPGWPYDLMAPPVDTDPRLASNWTSYVPITALEGNTLMQAAREGSGEARHRLTDLLRQLTERPEMNGVEGLHVCQMSWRNHNKDRVAATSTAVSTRDQRGNTPPDLEHASIDHLPRPLGRGHHPGKTSKSKGKPKGPSMPNHSDAPEIWRQWYVANPAHTPRWMLVDRANSPSDTSVEYHLLVRRTLGQGVSIQDRAVWIRLLHVLFSVPGMYNYIVANGGYPVRNHVETVRYPGPVAEVNIFRLAWWYAYCGITVQQANALQPLAVRARNERIGRMLDEPAPFNDDEYNSMDELPLIPTSQDLGMEHLITGAPPVPVIAPTTANAEPVAVRAPDAPGMPAAPVPHNTSDGNVPAPTVTIDNPVVDEDHEMADQSAVVPQEDEGIQSTPHPSPLNTPPSA
ncbi:hypothetical protein C8Q73DRAFT_652821 [Cubamyces lactineus]|nr:hypothetical protein C8Q73DRAFT_652821 [Cubamyces lactineus]